MVDLVALAAKNTVRWNAAKITRGTELSPVAKRLCAAKDRYQIISAGTGVPWFVIAVIHERESSQRFDRQLGQGDPLGEVSTHDPKGRGPFFNHPNDPPGQDAFYRAALDALIDCQPYAGRWKDWSPGGAMTLLEQYNGLGYASMGRPSPYVWSGTDQYVSGKYVADHVYDPNVVDRQLGCAGLIKAMMAIDPTIVFGSIKIAVPVPPPAAPPAKPSVTSPSPGSIGAFIASIFNAIFKRNK